MERELARHPGVTQDGPDFIGIGLPRAGTGWVWDQLRDQHDVWALPVKELGYLGRDEDRRAKLRAKADQALGKRQGQERWTNRVKSERDLRVLKRLSEAAGEGEDLAFYASLFAEKGEQLAGDITPRYAALPPPVIRRVAARFPQAKVFLMLRDPVERVWALLWLRVRAEALDAARMADLDFLKEMLGSGVARRSSFPTGVWQRWADFIPAENRRFFFFDDIRTRPAALRSEILGWLGADPEKRRGAIDPGHNRKTGGEEKPSMRPEVREFLVGHFAAELRACAEEFGGPARDWPARYGL